MQAAGFVVTASNEVNGEGHSLANLLEVSEGPMTWIEVTDSAIKIGLGALIAGLFTSLTSRSALERDARKRYAERRRTLLERAADRLVEYDKAYRHQKAAFTTLIGLDLESRDASPEKVMFETCDEKFRVAFEVFAEVSGILLLLGEPAVEDAMEAYRSECVEWHGRSLSTVSSEEAKGLASTSQRVVDARHRLMARLAFCYKCE